MTITGLLLGIIGLLLFMFAHRLSGYMHLLLTLPPVAVASYVFVVNLYKITNGTQLPFVQLCSELFHLVLVSSGFLVVFVLFTTAFIGLYIK